MRVGLILTAILLPTSAMASASQRTRTRAAARLSASIAVRPPVVSRPPVGIKGAAASTWYSELSQKHYLAIACAQSGILRASSDAVSQMMRSGTLEVDPAHALAMGTIGVLVSGLVGASWLRHLEGQLGSGTGARDVVKKAAADFFCYAPFANTAYLFFVPLLSMIYAYGMPYDVNAAVAAAATVAQHGFSSAMGLELMMFAPYNLLSFRLIPASFRPQTTAAACAGYTIALSSLC